jgi:hypothetical protein
MLFLNSEGVTPMIRNALLASCVLFALILIGCSKTETSNSNTATANSNKGATTATKSTTAPAGEKIGIAECDDFIAKYEACVSGKVPEAARASYQTALKQWRESWKKLAENPQTKGTLAAACKQAREQQETALKSYGCTW